jgi:hypothetical protein
MIDNIVNLFMITGVIIVSVPVLFFASVGLVHLGYGIHKMFSR